MSTEAKIKNDMETVKHINVVRSLLFDMILRLDQRGQVHDQSKLESPESEIFAENVDLLKSTSYGTPEYQKLLEKIKPATDHHYSKNRHHPEHWKNGIDDMNLIDLVEMLCDWVAATQRMKDGNILKSIEHNAKRFNISPQLVSILNNTVKEYNLH